MLRRAQWVPATLALFACLGGPLGAVGQVPVGPPATPAPQERPRVVTAAPKPAAVPEPEGDDDGAVQLAANLVLVSAVVTKDAESEKLVKGLTKADFTIFDEGVAQRIEFFGDETLPLNVEFLFDASESLVFKHKFQGTALATFLQGLLRSNDRASVIWFNEKVHVEQGFTSQTAPLLSAIERIPSGGATALYDAVAVGADRMSGESGRRAIVILSDGRDTFSETRLDGALKRVQGADAVIYAINTSRPAWAVTPEFRENDPLEFLASETGGEVFYPGDAEEVSKTLELLSARLRQRYVLGFYPSAAARDGRFRRIVVGVNRKNAHVMARTGYYAPK